MSLDLTGATLIDFDLANCTVTGEARFEGAVFSGDAGFHKAAFSGHARFDETTVDRGAHRGILGAWVGTGLICSSVTRVRTGHGRSGWPGS
jgi:hypothetical protein